ncbi:MAG: hypothetical protein Q9199_003889, partial [Rusavskia elegans]
AINSLKPYAITTQNAIATVLNPLKALGASSSAGDVSGVVDSLAAAGSDFSSLSGAADAWELDSFGPGGPIFSQVQTEQAALKTAAKSVADGLNQLRRCIQTPGICKNTYDTVAGLLAGGTIGGPLFWLYTYTGSSVSPSQTLKGRPPPAGVVTTNTATPSSWVLNTVPGTSVEAYKAFIQTLPDRGKGEQIIFGGAISHAYVGTWTLNEAKIISRDPVCDTMSSNARIKGNMQAFRSNNTAANLGFGLDKRAPNLKIVREKSQRYQKMVSFPKDKSFRDLNDNDPHWDYTFEESAGAGTWVYTFDHGFDWHHREFAGADIEDYVVPGIQNGAGDTVNSISDDLNGHGTQMAAAAVGLYGGIAKAAGIVGVKYASDINPEPRDVIKAWKWAVADVLAKEERHSKAVFNLPHVIPYRFWIGNNDHVPQHYSPPYNIPRPRYSDWVVPLLAEAWDAGVPVISSTGNVEQAGLVDTMGDASPQRFVKPDNPLIIVGGASADGSPSQYIMPAGPPSNNVDYDQQLQGGVTVYAHSENVEAAIPGNAEHPYDNYVTNSGASYACSYASGPEAYYLGLPTTVMPPRRVDNPQEMKRMLLRSARDGSQGGKGVIHNGVWDLPCSPPISPGSKMALRSSLSEADRVLRILKGLDGLMYG